MSDDRGNFTAFDWQELFPWTNLAKALRLAVQPRVLVLAAVALVGTVAGWRICGRACTALFLGSADTRAPPPCPLTRRRIDEAYRTQHLEDTINKLRAWPWEPDSTLAVGRGESIITTTPGSWWADNPVIRARNRLSAPFVGLFDPNAPIEEFVFLLFCALGAGASGHFSALRLPALPPSASRTTNNFPGGN